jgi:hypothetical protein
MAKKQSFGLGTIVGAVDGAPLKLAASAAGITVGGTSNAVQRVRRALGLAKIAAGLLVCS